MRKSKWLRTALLCIGGVFLFLAGIGLGWIRCRQTETAFWEYILIAPEPEEFVVCDNLQGPRFHAPCLLELSTEHGLNHNKISFGLSTSAYD